jgi:hypothetical protein
MLSIPPNILSPSSVHCIPYCRLTGGDSLARWHCSHQVLFTLCFGIIHITKHCSEEVRQHLSWAHHFDLFDLLLCFYSFHEAFPTGTLSIYCYRTHAIGWGKRGLWSTPHNSAQTQPMQWAAKVRNALWLVHRWSEHMGPGENQHI